MHFSIGKQLGEVLAVAELELVQNIENKDALERIALVSEAYRNFVQSGKRNFELDFDAGYKDAYEELWQEYTAQPSPAQLLGDYLPKNNPTQG